MLKLSNWGVFSENYLTEVLRIFGEGWKADRGGVFCFKARWHSRQIQSDVPTTSLLVSKAQILNLRVFAKHRLKAKLSVLLGVLCGQK